ncbi:hypothetical protein AVEN_179656-1 [Araneus ventricosus]|uniref:Uncharacterized protein n=1 Tax=Araneus ventricosus TaxID=182803 RepID=A0A4Y2JXQ5_ARAVE|nr:hypothetical protein AVEN_179656-1 [Araneus ventricosus]
MLRVGPAEIVNQRLLNTCAYFPGAAVHAGAEGKIHYAHPGTGGVGADVVHDPRSIPMASENRSTFLGRHGFHQPLRYMGLQQVGQPWERARKTGKFCFNRYSPAALTSSL